MGTTAGPSPDGTRDDLITAPSAHSREAAMPTTDATHTHTERLHDWLRRIDARARESTGAPALFAVELTTGRRFRGNLAPPEPDGPGDLVGFEPEGDDDATTVYVRLDAIVTVGLPADPPAPRHGAAG
jgi:hypothetical protein